MRFNRRELLGSVAASLVVPGTLARAAPITQRKFLFVFCPGGWDTTMVFAPIWSHYIEHHNYEEAASIGNIPYTTAFTRPAVDTLLEQYGDKTAFVNGILVPSVAHDVCTHWAMTGESQAKRDDWVSIIAGNAEGNLLLPNVHISGPIFPHDYPTSSVRIGSNGQLADLLSGQALHKSAVAVGGLPPDVRALQDSVLASRLDRWTVGRSDPAGMIVGEDEYLSRFRAEGLNEHLDILSGDTTDLMTAMSVGVSCLEAGLSRTAIVGYGMGGNGAWDLHAVVEFQDPMYQELFSALTAALDQLAAAPGANGGTLLDETTVVVLSEMGRTPSFNAAKGKDHWTYTSAMLIGSGIRGDQVIGGYDDGLIGEACNLDSGQVDANGTTLLPGHIGATLLHLADIDPDEYLEPGEGEVIPALLDI